ncbi:MAG: PHA/PHB synthase family protein [Alphaproteobacteria bacterium]
MSPNQRNQVIERESEERERDEPPAEMFRPGRAARPAERPGTREPPKPRDVQAEEEDREGLTATPPEIAKAPPALRFADRYSTQSFNRAFNAHLARFTSGISPFGLSSTFLAWWIHLMASPGKQVLLMEKAARKMARFMIFAEISAREARARPAIDPLPHDHRFDDEAWSMRPYNLIYQSFLLTQQWWHNATNRIEGLSGDQERVVSFVTRQLLDVISPSNFVWTNPEVARTTVEQGGANLVQGFEHFMEDWERAISGKLPVGAEEFVPGRDVATAEGKVVYRNHLVELIQYAPKTEKVKAEPVLIIPAWIMKYYVLDLSPHNSLVNYLVEQGYTVFMVSWRNPTAEDRNLGMDDYRTLGVEKTLEAVTEIVPGQKVHAIGYCIGGTLLAIAASAMARDGDDRFKTLTFLATQTDFTDAGELMLFISESQVSFLENMMWDQGYLDTKQMAGAFQLLRSNDLIWSRYIHEYLMGKRQKMFDLMAWNADATRLPYKMHSEYLRQLFLDNELAQGKYYVGEQPVALADIHLPVFCVSTTKDHVAPWRSVYKLHLLADTDITFVLTNGGHNAGIVSEPGHKGRRYQIRTTLERDRFLSPQAWQEDAELRDGSWWPSMSEWLAGHSSGETDPPPMSGETRRYRPLVDAPGTYVFQR